MTALRNPLARIIGTPTIHPVPFAAAKLSLVVIVVMPVLQMSGVPLAEPVPGTKLLAGILLVVGVALLLVASEALGNSLRVGLPTDATTLRTSGIYRFSRHPIYLSIFILSIAASLYCPHPAVIVASIFAVAAHHAIALAEERFLEQRFGAAWTVHKNRVPRYIGIPRKS